MPTIIIKYDDEKVSDPEIKELSNATQKIVSNITGIEDVFVYADSPKIIVKAAPIELYVEMSAHKIENLNELFSKIKTAVSEWKEENNFSPPINLTVTPMTWKFDIDI